LGITAGSMGKPLPGIEGPIVDDSGKELPSNRMGNLAMKAPWPAMLRDMWNNSEKYKSYTIADRLVSGPSAVTEAHGYLFCAGRTDDVIRTAGERVGPFEIESKVGEHQAVQEAGVIGKPDPVRGEIVKAFIALREGYEPSDEVKEEIRNFVKLGLAAHA